MNITTFLARPNAASTGNLLSRLCTVKRGKREKREEKKEKDEDENEDEEEKVEKSLGRTTDERDDDDDDGGIVLVVTNVERAFNVAFANWNIKSRL
ncbi:hypothetical protein K0M31_016943 [Melipona bicolor]|uniref:Uncharacterized protein n=1 Tax=Melipona bicolor TaxID=60889 RepID=A0AA40KEI5_9HYME|nr:hypothetical protein K0M31_016943 [Melipona bicolor]